jgi:Ca-activated chloride channel family protein
MSEFSDHQLDARLREAPLPEGLLDRLRSVTVPNDVEIDRQLREVPLPAGMMARLGAALEDEIIAEQLADVPVPVTLAARLRVVPQLRTRSTAGRFALAASLMIALGGAYLSALGGLLDQMRPREPVEAAYLPLDPPLETEVGYLAEVRLSQTPPDVAPVPQHVSPAVSEIVLDAPPQSRTPTPGPAGALWQELYSGLQLAQDVVAIRFDGSVFTHHADDDLPELEPSPRLLTGGFEPPLVAGFDRATYFNQRVIPRVSPAAHETLRRSQPPLSTRTASVERLRQRLAEGSLPDVAEIRVEDFLAAMDYQLPPAPARKLAIRTAAGPSVFDHTGAGLLQVGVKAGPMPRSDQRGAHLIVALDASASMRWRDRLDACREGLRRAVAHLTPQDRLSLVAFNEQVIAAVEHVAGRDDQRIEQLYRLLDELRPGGGTNLALALQQAVSLGLSDPQRTARIVLITDGPGDMPPQLTAQVHELLRTAAADGVTLSVIELGDAAEIDFALEQLAGAGSGLFYQASTSQHVRWTLVEAIAGRSSLVAADAELEVAFNPQTVEAYRLLGHERTTLAGLEPVTLTADLHSDEEATALYEIWLKPGGGDDVAVARVRWRDPASGEMRASPPQRISRLQFALSFEQSPLSLQAAAVAAEAAEVLRESPFAVGVRARSLRAVLSQADRVNPLLAERPAFASFVELISAAEQTRVRRPSP